MPLILRGLNNISIYVDVAELLNLDTMFLMASNVGYSGENYDANNFLDFKVYRYDRLVKDIPDNSDGQIVTLKSILNVDSSPIAQIAITSSAVFYYRVKWYHNDWSDWKKVSIVGD